MTFKDVTSCVMNLRLITGAYVAIDPNISCNAAALTCWGWGTPSGSATNPLQVTVWDRHTNSSLRKPSNLTSVDKWNRIVSLHESNVVGDSRYRKNLYLRSESTNGHYSFVGPRQLPKPNKTRYHSTKTCLFNSLSLPPRNKVISRFTNKEVKGWGNAALAALLILVSFNTNLKHCLSAL